MAAEFSAVFESLKPALAPVAKSLVVKTDTAGKYALVTKSPSPFPQHKGHPMDFAWIEIGKAYVSFHLMPIYMDPKLTKLITPELKKRMQGKSCFNFKGSLKRNWWTACGNSPWPRWLRGAKKSGRDAMRKCNHDLHRQHD